MLIWVNCPFVSLPFVQSKCKVLTNPAGGRGGRATFEFCTQGCEQDFSDCREKLGSLGTFCTFQNLVAEKEDSVLH